MNDLVNAWVLHSIDKFCQQINKLRNKLSILGYIDELISVKRIKEQQSNIYKREEKQV